jgi:hypothetical protein
MLVNIFLRERYSIFNYICKFIRGRLLKSVKVSSYFLSSVLIWKRLSFVSLANIEHRELRNDTRKGKEKWEMMREGNKREKFHMNF